MAEVVDIKSFRKSEQPDVSLYMLIEQAEALVILQQAVLDDCRFAPSTKPKKLDAVANSLAHLRQHLETTKLRVASLAEAT